MFQVRVMIQWYSCCRQHTIRILFWNKVREDQLISCCYFPGTRWSKWRGGWIAGGQGVCFVIACSSKSFLVVGWSILLLPLLSHPLSTLVYLRVFLLSFSFRLPFFIWPFPVWLFLSFFCSFFALFLSPFLVWCCFSFSFSFCVILRSSFLRSSSL